MAVGRRKWAAAGEEEMGCGTRRGRDRGQADQAVGRRHVDSDGGGVSRRRRGGAGRED